MSARRSCLAVFGLAIVIVSLIVLAYAFWPVPRETEVVPMDPGQLRLPTPTALHDQTWMLDWPA